MQVQVMFYFDRNTVSRLTDKYLKLQKSVIFLIGKETM